MTPLVLRPYQINAIDRLRRSYAARKRGPLFQLATAAGKTVVFAEITRSAQARGRRVLVVEHRRELLQQASGKLDWASVPHGIVAADFAPAPELPVQVYSVQTAARRLNKLGEFDFIIVDECHHCRGATWGALLAAQPKAKILGVTATPARLDGRGLGIQVGGVFDDLVCGPSIAELTKGGYLSKAEYFVPQSRVDLYGVRSGAGDWVAAEVAQRVDHTAITGDAVQQYSRRAAHQPAIGFCAVVSHAEHVAEQFRLAGFRAACVHGSLPKPERDRLIAGLGTGEIEVLASCDLISEGLDVPALGAVILLRPTQSLMHMQQIGRGLRPAPGKDALVVLDHVGNIERHGRPDFERIWTLNGVEKKPGAAPVRICPQCDHANPMGATECEVCGFEFPAAGGGRRAPAHVPGWLGELSSDRLRAVLRLSYRQVVTTRLSEAELRAYQQFHGYKPGWVFYRLLEQEQAP